MVKFRILDTILRVEVGGPLFNLKIARLKAKRLNKEYGTRRFITDVYPEVKK